ncbi:hypothetical protein ADUPG1_012972, partial [Aduncisulcus paluster]
MFQQHINPNNFSSCIEDPFADERVVLETLLQAFSEAVESIDEVKRSLPSDYHLTGQEEELYRLAEVLNLLDEMLFSDKRLDIFVERIQTLLSSISSQILKLFVKIMGDRRIPATYRASLTNLYSRILRFACGKDIPPELIRPEDFPQFTVLFSRQILKLFVKIMGDRRIPATYRASLTNLYSRILRFACGKDIPPELIRPEDFPQFTVLFSRFAHRTLSLGVVSIVAEFLSLGSSSYEHGPSGCRIPIHEEELRQSGVVLLHALLGQTMEQVLYRPPPSIKKASPSRKSTYLQHTNASLARSKVISTDRARSYDLQHTHMAQDRGSFTLLRRPPLSVCQEMISTIAPTLLRTLRYDPSEGVREYCAYVLGKLAHITTVHSLIDPHTAVGVKRLPDLNKKSSDVRERSAPRGTGSDEFFPTTLKHSFIGALYLKDGGSARSPADFSYDTSVESIGTSSIPGSSRIIKEKGLFHVCSEILSLPVPIAVKERACMVCGECLNILLGDGKSGYQESQPPSSPGSKPHSTPQISTPTSITLSPSSIHAILSVLCSSKLSLTLADIITRDKDSHLVLSAILLLTSIMRVCGEFIRYREERENSIKLLQSTISGAVSSEQLQDNPSILTSTKGDSAPPNTGASGSSSKSSELRKELTRHAHLSRLSQICTDVFIQIHASGVIAVMLRRVCAEELEDERASGWNGSYKGRERERSMWRQRKYEQWIEENHRREMKGLPPLEFDTEDSDDEREAWIEHTATSTQAFSLSLSTLCALCVRVFFMLCPRGVGERLQWIKESRIRQAKERAMAEAAAEGVACEAVDIEREGRSISIESSSAPTPLTVVAAHFEGINFDNLPDLFSETSLFACYFRRDSIERLLRGICEGVDESMRDEVISRGRKEAQRRMKCASAQAGKDGCAVSETLRTNVAANTVFNVSTSQQIGSIPPKTTTSLLRHKALELVILLSTSLLASSVVRERVKEIFTTMKEWGESVRETILCVLGWCDPRDIGDVRIILEDGVEISEEMGLRYGIVSEGLTGSTSGLSQKDILSRAMSSSSLHSEVGSSTGSTAASIIPGRTSVLSSFITEDSLAALFSLLRIDRHSLAQGEITQHRSTATRAPSSSSFVPTDASLHQSAFQPEEEEGQIGTSYWRGDGSGVGSLLPYIVNAASFISKLCESVVRSGACVGDAVRKQKRKNGAFGLLKVAKGKDGCHHEPSSTSVAQTDASIVSGPTSVPSDHNETKERSDLHIPSVEELVDGASSPLKCPSCSKANLLMEYDREVIKGVCGSGYVSKEGITRGSEMEDLLALARQDEIKKAKDKQLKEDEAARKRAAELKAMPGSDHYLSKALYEASEESEEEQPLDPDQPRSGLGKNGITRSTLDMEDKPRSISPSPSSKSAEDAERPLLPSMGQG